MSERMWRKGSSHVVNGNVNWYSHHRRQYRGSSKKLELKLPCDPTTSLLGTHPKDRKSVCLVISVLSCLLYVIHNSEEREIHPYSSTTEWIIKIR